MGEQDANTLAFHDDEKLMRESGPTKSWSAHSLTKAFARAHPTAMGYAGWIAPDCPKKKGDKNSFSSS